MVLSPHSLSLSLLSLQPFIYLPILPRRLFLIPCPHHRHLESTSADMEELVSFSMYIVYQSMCVGIIVAIDKFVVRRRDAIVQTVRRLQAILRIPSCLSVVSDTAPGITDESLRFGTELSVFLGIMSHVLFVSVVVAGKVKSPLGLITGIVIPAFVTIFVWIDLIRARQAFDRGERDVFDKDNVDNPGLRRALLAVG
ncbi:hypothetical protein F5B18DRAFT_87496 [Nemania serpens]|nr:hypothetical protein F5B18DRAFT_87496 [Nemania serpens]